MSEKILSGILVFSFAQAGLLLRIVVICLALTIGLAAQTPPQPVSSTPDNAAIGIEFYQQENFKAAVVNLRQAVKKQSKNDATAWNYLGLALVKTREMKEAGKAFEEAVKLNPNNEAWRINLAYLWLETDDLKKAVKEAEKILSRNSGSLEALYIIGMVRLQQNKDSEALERAMMILALKNDYAPAWLLKSQALLRIGMLSHGNKSGTSTDKLLRSVNGLITTERKQRFAKAADSLEEYLRLVPDNHQAETWRSVMEGLRSYLRMTDLSNAQRNVFEVSEPGVTKPIPVRLERARYTEEARQNKVQGTIVLLVVVSTDGLAIPLIVVQGLPHGLTEKAIEAARNLRFKPATKDGKPVTVVVPVEFYFSIF